MGWSKTFWLDTAERALSSTALSFLSTLAIGAGWNPFTADWKSAIGVAAGTGLLTLFKSLAASKVGDSNSASLLPTAFPPSSPEHHGAHEKA